MPYQKRASFAYESFYGSSKDKDVTFGIRPEDIADALPEDSRGRWEKSKAVVEVIEPLGAEIILELAAGQQNFTARVDPHSKSQLNQEVDVYFDMKKMHLFDPETQQVIPRQ